MVSASQAVGELVYAVSHDFGRPLRQIAAFTELLRDKHLQEFDDESSAWVDYLLRAGQEAQNMLDRLLIYSRLYSQENAPVAQDLLPLGRQIVTRLSERHPDRDIEFRGDCSGCVDQSLFTLIVSELLDNALSYSEPGPVRVELDQKNDELRCRILDPGPGIDPTRLDAASRAFGRLHPEDPDHVGLGLNIVQRALVVAGGNIAFAGVDNGWSATVKLPV